MSQVFEPKEKTLIANTYIYEIGIKTNLLYLFLFDFLLVEKGFSIHPIQYLMNKKKNYKNSFRNFKRSDRKIDT